MIVGWRRTAHIVADHAGKLLDLLGCGGHCRERN